MSLSGDTTMTMPVAPVGYSGGSGGGFGNWGGDGCWFLIILFLFVFCGWGNGNWGGNGGMNGGVGSEVQRGFDHSSVVTKLDGITQGICDSTYALNNTMTTGFSNAELSRCNQQSALMQQLFAMQMQNQNCCCENEKGQLMIQNAMERGFCQTSYNDQANTNAIIQNSHNDTDRVLAKLDAMEMARKDETIDALRSQVNALNLAQSQANQNAVFGAKIDAATAELLRRTGHDCPTAAYIVQPPTPVNFPTNCCGTFTGFGGNCAA